MQPLLDTLNLCKNGIGRISGLSHLTQLRTLLLAHNRLASPESIAHLTQVHSLDCVDLQENQLADGPGVLDVLAALPRLSVLYLQGNPLVGSLPHYRKVVVGRLKSLRYLDDRPVFDDERARCDAWWAAFQGNGAVAAAEAEIVEMARQRAAAAAEEERQFRGFGDFIRGVHGRGVGEGVGQPEGHLNSDSAGAAIMLVEGGVNTTADAAIPGHNETSAAAPPPSPSKVDLRDVRSGGSGQPLQPAEDGTTAPTCNPSTAGASSSIDTTAATTTTTTTATATTTTACSARTPYPPHWLTLDEKSGSLRPIAAVKTVEKSPSRMPPAADDATQSSRDVYQVDLASAVEPLSSWTGPGAGWVASESRRGAEVNYYAEEID